MVDGDREVDGGRADEQRRCNAARPLSSEEHFPAIERVDRRDWKDHVERV